MSQAARLSDAAAHESASHGAILARGAFFNTIAFFSSNLRGIFIFLIARLLGSEILGTFGLAWSAMDLLSKFGTFGLDTSGVAFVAKAEVAGDRTGSRRIMKAALTVALGNSVVLSALGFSVVWTFGPRLGYRPELSQAVAVMLLAIPGISLYRVSNAMSRGMAIMHHDIYSRGFTESLGTAAAFLVAIFFGFKQFAPQWAAIVGTLASGVVAYSCARRLFIPLRSSSAPNDKTLVPRLLRASVPITLYDFLNLGIMHLDVLMLGFFVGRVPGLTLRTLGIYAAAVQLVGGVRKVNQIFTPIFTPIIARQISAGHMSQAEATYGYLARWMLAILLPAVAVFALSGGAVMTLFGAPFYAGGVWAAIIAGACAINAFVGLGETILMIDRPQINLRNSAICFVTTIGLNLFLIPAFGALGAALGMLVPYCLQGTLRGIAITRLLHWHWPWRAMFKPWLAALAALPFALIVRLSFRGTLLELTAAAAYLGAYLIAWRLIGLDKSDRAVIDHLLRGRRRARQRRSSIQRA